ncbi:MAG: nucleotidyltransferase domain-containing protein [Thiobacillaceae bacterium]|nr:nucleotidyltransferase domain-containing protein [Thiobacillaceae bacterium]
MPIVSWNSYADVSAYNRKLQQALAEAAGTTLWNHPEVLGIWLFGSRARGDFGARSDVDLLVMVNTARPLPMDRLLDYRDLLARIPAPVDLLVLTLSEFEAMRDQPFYRRLRHEARPLSVRPAYRHVLPATVPQ